MKDQYIDMIIKLLETCDDLSLLNFILQLLQKIQNA